MAATRACFTGKLPPDHKVTPLRCGTSCGSSMVEAAATSNVDGRLSVYHPARSSWECGQCQLKASDPYVPSAEHQVEGCVRRPSDQRHLRGSPAPRSIGVLEFGDTAVLGRNARKRGCGELGGDSTAASSVLIYYPPPLNRVVVVDPVALTLNDPLQTPFVDRPRSKLFGSKNPLHFATSMSYDQPISCGSRCPLGAANDPSVEEPNYHPNETPSSCSTPEVNMKLSPRSHAVSRPTTTKSSTIPIRLPKKTVEDDAFAFQNAELDSYYEELLAKAKSDQQQKTPRPTMSPASESTTMERNGSSASLQRSSFMQPFLRNTIKTSSTSSTPRRQQCSATGKPLSVAVSSRAPRPPSAPTTRGVSTASAPGKARPSTAREMSNKTNRFAFSAEASSGPTVHPAATSPSCCTPSRAAAQLNLQEALPYQVPFFRDRILTQGRPSTHSVGGGNALTPRRRQEGRQSVGKKNEADDVLLPSPRRPIPHTTADAAMNDFAEDFDRLVTPHLVDEAEQYSSSTPRAPPSSHSRGAPRHQHSEQQSHANSSILLHRSLGSGFRLHNAQKRGATRQRAQQRKLDLSSATTKQFAARSVGRNATQSQSEAQKRKLLDTSDLVRCAFSAHPYWDRQDIFNDVAAMTVAINAAASFNRRCDVHRIANILVPHFVGVLDSKGASCYRVDTPSPFEAEHFEEEEVIQASDRRVLEREDLHQAFMHYTWEASGHAFAVKVTRCNGNALVGVEVATNSYDGEDSIDNENEKEATTSRPFGRLNGGVGRLQEWANEHQCGAVCRALKLTPMVVF